MNICERKFAKYNNKLPNIILESLMTLISVLYNFSKVSPMACTSRLIDSVFYFQISVRIIKFIFYYV